MVSVRTEEETRCRLVSRAMGTDPVGTAGSYNAFVLVQRPLPWPADAADDPELTALVDAIARARAGGASCRLQLVLPSSPEAPAVIFYRRPGGLAAAYQRVELAPGGTVNPVEAAAEALPEVISGVAPAADDDLIDLLICTHGRRDMCCGTAGMRLWTAVLERGPADRVRLWRTSHTGGHRFAPTAVVLPYGQMWAWLEPELLWEVLERRLDPRLIAGHYRGSTLMDSPAQQALEREAFAARGWAWLDRPKAGAETRADDGRVRAVVRFDDDSGRSGRYEATVRVGRRLPVPECGRPVAEAVKSQDELVVEDIRLLGAR
ncbi:MAG TPA: sucrase ferredoxin [Acidimicrobiales bacterium]|nr:sucrase ferredoxin [Acidimicrobiales bacterium]